MYQITNRQRQIAKKIGVYIFPSDKPKYKIDIYDNEGIYHTSIGDISYNDYFTYLKRNGKAYADNRRRLYDLRTKKGLSIGSRNWFARKILWDLD
jgi:hypothetical protein